MISGGKGLGGERGGKDRKARRGKGLRGERGKGGGK